MANNLPPQIKPISVRQLAIALLILLVLSALSLFFIYQRKKSNDKFEQLTRLAVPKLIKPQFRSESPTYESMSFSVPLVK